MASFMTLFSGALPEAIYAVVCAGLAILVSKQFTLDAQTVAAVSVLGIFVECLASVIGNAHDVQIMK